MAEDFISSVSSEEFDKALLGGLDAANGKFAKKEDIPSVPTKVSELENDVGYLKSFAEADPTVPAWAKAATKPSYTKSEVGLGNVDNVKQYSASNPPPYPVTSVNGKTGAVTVAVPEIVQETGDSESAVMSQKAVTDALGYPPSYWMDELENKANEIQQAVERAGQSKSAFLWYTDSHWTAGNSKVSPALLKYLFQNTPINKVNFGGDIIGDPSTLTHADAAGAYEWRNMIFGLPNHHSVIGNHDNLHKGTDDSDVSNLVYSFLIAPEESADMAVGGDFYYYIDNPCEKTRYVYLDSGRYRLTDDETAFIIDALKATPNGWHIVVISHIWFQYNSASAPTVGNMNAYMQKALNLFDAYNARQSGNITMVSTKHSYDFSDCGGKVEFCIGGHIHVDYDLASSGGIPVILTASDVNQDRSVEETEDSGTIGTTTESAVFGIVANYTTREVSVVGVGRGTSRTVVLKVWGAYTNLADPTSAEWLTGYRLSTSGTSELAGNIVTNYIPCSYQDVIRIKGLDVRSITTGNARYHICGSDKALVVADSGYVADLIAKGYASVDGDIITITAGMIGATGSYTAEVAYQRFCGVLMDGYTAEDVVITVNEEIT